MADLMANGMSGDYSPMTVKTEQRSSSGAAREIAMATMKGAREGRGRYLTPFDVIKRPIEMSTSQGRLIATASYDDLLRMIKLLLLMVDVDEDWYLAQYPDVAEAVNEGTVASALQHFIDNGYFECRLPFLMAVDDNWYESEYPDVAESIRRGIESSAQAHFVRTGYREGRLPRPI